MNRLTILLISVLFSTTAFTQMNVGSLNNNPYPTNPNNDNILLATHKFLFVIPVKGQCTTEDDKRLDDSVYLFNYDLTDKKVIISSSTNNYFNEVSIQDLKQVEFSTAQGKLLYETNVAVKRNELLQVLAKTKNKYILYKYEPNLNKLQEPLYYIVLPDEQIRKINLQKKDIKDLLKVNPQSLYFFNNHKKDKVDENFLVQIITYLNYF